MINMAGFPFSDIASQEAGELFARQIPLSQPSVQDGFERLRAYYGELDRQRADSMLRHFSVDVETSEIAGVPVQTITPKDGVAKGNTRRILINLHGGAFMWGGEYGGLVESIPISDLGKFRIVSIDYRLAPEHNFPAASKDVAAVYAELLRCYDASSIGIYGCSAGGVLTTQVIAWLDRSRLPLPGAIGTFSGTGLELGGDSSQLAPHLTGRFPVPVDEPALKLMDLPYFRGASASDPLVFPLASEALMRKFPPTLLIAGGRDFAASSLTLAHRKLAVAGRDSRLFLFDGLWHAFFVDPELPESCESYSLICRFFIEHLRKDFD